MKKKKSIFVFEKEYGDSAYTKKASVELHVNDLSGTFDVKPPYGGGFCFEGNSGESEMWLAVAELIKESIEFGRHEIGQENRDDRA